MPQVPIQTTPMVSPSGGGMPFVQGNRVTPVKVENAGRTAQNIGTALTGVGELMADMQVQRDDMKTKQATLAYLNDLNAREAEFKAKNGTNAIDAYPDYQKSVEELNRKYAETLENDVQISMFSAFTAKYGGAAITSGATHVYTQQRNVNIASSQSMAVTSANTALKYALEGDQLRAADALKLSNQNLQDAGRLAGKPQEEIDLDIKKNTSDVLINTATGYLAQHKLQLASTYLEKQHKSGALIEEDYIAAKNKIKGAIDSHNSTVEALRIFEESGNDYTKALRTAKEIGGEEGVRITDALLSMRNRQEAVEQVIAEEHATKFNEAWNQMREFELTGASVINPELLSALTEEERSMIAKGWAEYNTYAAETEIMQALRTGGKAWAAFQATRLPLLRNQLTEESYTSFAKISNPGEVAQAYVNEDMLREVMDMSGYGNLKDNDAKRYRIRRMVDDRIVSAQIDKGRALTEPEKRGIAVQTMALVIEDDAYGWSLWDTSKRGPDVTIKDIPERVADKIREDLRQAGKLSGDPKYDDQVIVETWIRLKSK